MEQAQVFTIVGWLFVVMSPIALLYEGYLRLKAKKAESWPHEEGEITHSEVETGTSGGGSGRVTFRANIKYKYKVKRRTYKNDKVFVGNVKVWVNYKNEAEQTCREYPVGKTVRVLYNPKRPSEACLEPRV
ncbi:MAG: DUF3592 domain-containing protein, partial [Nitrospinae bacterium]|nr:DUF3592 domain-containing protein [Nitrospinota bacterium]